MALRLTRSMTYDSLSAGRGPYHGIMILYEEGARFIYILYEVFSFSFRVCFLNDKREIQIKKIFVCDKNTRFDLILFMNNFSSNFST